MLIHVLTLFPEMIDSALKFGVLGSALEKSLLEVKTVSPREFTDDRHRTVDDRPFGGGDGMVMLYEPLAKALLEVQSASVADTGSTAVDSNRLLSKKRVIYLSPQGQALKHKKVLELSNLEEIVLVCGRYGGIDQRFINEFVDEEISVGDYVLSGGELAALTVIDAVSRQLPGVLGHAESAEKDSFADGLLECPNFTRPRELTEGKDGVPEVLASGNHKLIAEWRFKVSCLITKMKRPDIFSAYLVNYVSPTKKAPPLMVTLEKFWQEELSAKDKAVLGFKDWNFDE